MSRSTLQPEHPPKVTDLLIAEGRATRSRVLQSIQSWIAHALHADAAGLRRHILGKFRFRRAAPPAPKDQP